MWQGAVGVTPVDGLVSPAYIVAKPLAGTEPRYFGALFRTSAYMAEVDKYSRGIVKDRNRLYWEDFKQMPIPCPPPDEQVLIADAIDCSTATTDEGIQRIERQIALLHEYRTRLTADVVTGKLDVREAAVELPKTDRLADDRDRPGTISAEPNHTHVRIRHGKGGERMTDWSTCPAVERNPRKISGAWAFTGTRVPVYALFENLESGATVQQFLEWYPEVKEWQVAAVLNHETEYFKTPA
jgi:uncharacterized protein (DUF433 family)